MMPARVPCLPENLLGLSWHDSALLPMLNASTVLDYFSERSNPFYDRTCNNETIKMQRLNPEQLNNLVGIEYTLLHVQEPILFVVRKQHRSGPGPNQTMPIADYYIIAGVVYQAPDLISVINSRMLTTVFHLQSAFDELFGMMRYQPSKGYSWDVKAQMPASSNAKKDIKEEPSSLFQRQRVDMLLVELTRRFPLPVPRTQAPEAIENGPESAQTPRPDTSSGAATSEKLDEPMATIKEEKQDSSATSPTMKPPPEKKARMN